MYNLPMLRQPFLNEQWGPSRFSSVLYSANVCIMLQECSGFVTRPDGERWHNTQINQKYILDWEHEANINFEQIFTNIKSGCALFKTAVSKKNNMRTIGKRCVDAIQSLSFQ